MEKVITTNGFDMNTQTQEALKMAIEKLQESNGVLDTQTWKTFNNSDAINACKEALESQEQVNSSNLLLQMAQSELARIRMNTNDDNWYRIHKARVYIKEFIDNKKLKENQEPVACPYPCGWNNLYKITTEKGAYLVTHFDIDNPMPYSYWQEISSMVDTARTLVKWGMNIKTHPAQPLNDDEIAKIIGEGAFYEWGDMEFARAIEKAHGIGE